MFDVQSRLSGPDSKTFLTEGGIETHMQYKKGWELPHFCLFDLMNDPKAVADIRAYHVRIIEVALTHLAVNRRMEPASQQ